MFSKSIQFFLGSTIVILALLAFHLDAAKCYECSQSTLQATDAGGPCYAPTASATSIITTDGNRTVCFIHNITMTSTNPPAYLISRGHGALPPNTETGKWIEGKKETGKTKRNYYCDNNDLCNGEEIAKPELPTGAASDDQRPCNSSIQIIIFLSVYHLLSSSLSSSSE